MRNGFLQNKLALHGWVLRVYDSIVILAAAYIALNIRFEEDILPTAYVAATIFTYIFSIIINSTSGVYQTRRYISLLHELSRLLVSWFITVAWCASLAYLTKTGELFSRIWFVSWMFSALIVMIVGRIALHVSVNSMHNNGRGVTKSLSVIVGAGDLGVRLLTSLKQRPWIQTEVIGFFDDDIKLVNKNISGIPVIGPTENLESQIETLHKKNVGHVWIALPISAGNRIRELVESLTNTTTTIHLVPDIFGYSPLEYSLDDFDGLPVINLSGTPHTGTMRVVKEIEDKILGLISLLVFSPLMGIIAALVKLDSPGPILYKQQRYGLDGKEISVFKFRTMCVCENGDSAIQAKRNDPRVTKIGRFLRRSSLDELPQLFNVLAGNMSLVGPRPHPISLNEQYRNMISSYMLRHKVKPGITGWAQVNGWRGETETMDKMEKRIQYDVEYINRWSIWMDLKILFLTVFRGFTGPNAF